MYIAEANEEGELMSKNTCSSLKPSNLVYFYF
jgi:hypothetical protein